MCEMLGQEPDQSQLPISREDLALETQMVLGVYDKLQSSWEGFSGTYLGKNLTLLPILFEQYEFENDLKQYAWYIIPIIDNFVADDIAKKVKSKTKVKGDMPGGGHYN